MLRFISTIILTGTFSAAPLGAKDVASDNNVKAEAKSETLQDQVKATVRRSLPYLEKRGKWWIQKKDCVSCHRVSMMTWT